MQAFDIRTKSGNRVRGASADPATYGYQRTDFEPGSDASRSLDAAVEASGLSYPVRSKPVFVEDETSLGGIQHVPAHQAIYRPDTGHIFGIQGADYTIAPATAGFSALQPLLDSGEISLISGGHTDHGARIFLTAELSRARADVGLGDTVRLLLTFLNSYDGSTTARVALNAQRVVCLNGCTRMFALQGLNVRHTRNVVARLESVTLQLEQAREGLQRLAETGRALRRKRLSDRDLTRLIRETLSEGAGDDPSIRVKHVERIEELAHTAPGADPGTLWGGLNALTYWASHERGRNDNSRTNANLFGNGAALMDRAFETAVRFAADLPSNEAGYQATQNFATAGAEFGALLGRPARISSEQDDAS